jgi:hypothetical protein
MGTGHESVVFRAVKNELECEKYDSRSICANTPRGYIWLEKNAETSQESGAFAVCTALPGEAMDGGAEKH